VAHSIAEIMTKSHKFAGIRNEMIQLRPHRQWVIMAVGSHYHFMDFPNEAPVKTATVPSNPVHQLRAIAYSMDVLIPGFYLWTPLFNWRIGGSIAEATYPGQIHQSFGIALVLPGYRIFTTYRDSYDPRSPQN
jgi:hypothetical protein